MPPPRPSLVVLDTETTGLDPRCDRIIDIGAVRLDDRLAVTDRFTTLVDPGMPIPLHITRLTGIDTGLIAGAPLIAGALRDLREFVGDATLVAHNADFDRLHLTAAAERSGLPPLTNDWFDTLDAALLLLPEFDRHALRLLMDELGLTQVAHRALPDAEAAAAVLSLLARRAAGLAESERRLLERAAWTPLRLLDACGAPPDASAGAPSERGAGGARGARATGADEDPGDHDEPPATGGGLPALRVARDGWRRELGADGDAAPAGLAARLPGYRRRNGQVAYAAATARLLDRGGVGVFEAGTGMGKSLGYLLPAAYASAAAGRRIVVSTKTKALQRQLADRELPLVAAGLPPEWRWTLLMGRENYLCRRRLDEAAAEIGEALPDPDRALALAYISGRARRTEVDLSALPYRAVQVLPALADLARELRSTRATCLGRFCPSRGRCHWRRARARAEAAHLVCVNHALLLSGRDVLPPFEDVIIDEAHLLYHEATEAFSRKVDALGLEQLINDLRGSRRQRGLGQRLRALARKMRGDEGRMLSAAADACELAAEELPALSRALAQAVAALAATANEQQAAPGRGRGPAPPSSRDVSYATSVWLSPGLRDLPEHDALLTQAALLAERLAALATAAALGADALPEISRERASLAIMADEAAAAAELLSELSDAEPPNSVSWAEIEGVTPPGGTPRWALTRAPVLPGDGLRELLWDRLRSALLTSATLTVAGSFDYLREMAGLTGDVDPHEQVFPSPFDYRRQAVVVLEHDPCGAWRPDELPARHGERLKRIAEVTGGRTLALFTNRRDMHSVAAALGAHTEDDGVLVLAQGMHGSAASLADEFRAHPETILLGVDTLWTGQDFPGDSLTCLVIARLPFPRLDPLVLARRRACEEAGERWFERSYLPEAVLKFRQGFGRLIRSESDRGVVVVLDHRLTQKSYRREFLASLPDMEVVEAPPSEVAPLVGHHLRRLGAIT